MHEDNIYIGMTSTSLSRRLSCHISNLTSSIIDHLKSHNIAREEFRKTLVDNTKILTRNTCQIKLTIIEALLIKETKPSLNKVNFQQGNNVLAIFWMLPHTQLATTTTTWPKKRAYILPLKSTKYTHKKLSFETSPLPEDGHKEVRNRRSQHKPGNYSTQILIWY